MIDGKNARHQVHQAESEQHGLDKAAAIPAASSTQTYQRTPMYVPTTNQAKYGMLFPGFTHNVRIWQMKQGENRIRGGCLVKANCLTSCSLVFFFLFSRVKHFLCRPVQVNILSCRGTTAYGKDISHVCFTARDRSIVEQS